MNKRWHSSAWLIAISVWMSFEVSVESRGSGRCASGDLQLSFSQVSRFCVNLSNKHFFVPVVLNLSLSRLRRRRHFEDPSVLWSTADSRVRDPQIERQRLLDMLAELPEQYRSLVILRFADQMSLDEIAHSSGHSEVAFTQYVEEIG